MSEAETALRRLSESNADLTGEERDFLVSAADEIVSLKRQLAAERERQFIPPARGMFYCHPDDIAFWERARTAESRLAEAVRLLERWPHDGCLQTFEHREQFRAEVRAFLSEPAARQEEK